MDNTNQPIQNPQPESQVGHAHSSKTKLLLIGLGVLFVLGIGGAYVLGTKNNQPVQTQVAVSPTGYQQTPVDEWKTYSDNTYGYTVQYPSTWKILTRVPEQFAVIQYDQPGHENSKMFGDCDLFMQDTNVPTTIIAVDLIEKQSDGGFCWSVGNFYDNSTRTITSFSPAKTIQVSKWQINEYLLNGKLIKPEWKGDKFQQFNIDGQNNIAVVALANQDSDSKQAEAVYDRILSSFKFTDQGQAGDTANWKTYNSTKYGFIFKYPTSYESFDSENTILYARTKSGGILSVEARPVSLKDYSFMDVGGTTHRFDANKKQWVNDGGDSANSPVKTNTPFEAYKYGIGDGGCSGESVLIPHPSRVLVLEITSTFCIIVDEATGETKNPIKELSTETLLSTFKFTD